MIKLDIINEVVNRTGITKTKAEMAVETVFETMKKALEHGDRIELRGFGVFNVKPRKTGIGRNPRTGAEVSIPPGKAVRFKPGKLVGLNAEGHRVDEGVRFEGPGAVTETTSNGLAGARSDDDAHEPGDIAVQTSVQLRAMRRAVSAAVHGHHKEIS